jgi:hypothetical protein
VICSSTQNSPESNACKSNPTTLRSGDVAFTNVWCVAHAYCNSSVAGRRTLRFLMVLVLGLSCCTMCIAFTGCALIAMPPKMVNGLTSV